MPNLLYEPRPDGLTAKALSRLWLPLPTAAYRLALKEDTIDEEWEKNSNLAIRDALWEGAFFATPFPGDETFGRDYVPLRGIAAGFALSAYNTGRPDTAIPRHASRTLRNAPRDDRRGTGPRRTVQAQKVGGQAGHAADVERQGNDPLVEHELAQLAREGAEHARMRDVLPR
ncbi:MAG: hypothetical protein OXG44_07340 [Gammaproteobacteria bacterium]|nr:hypothetical protein [Gammaproteobacteria bacterium]